MMSYAFLGLTTVSILLACLYLVYRETEQDLPCRPGGSAPQTRHTPSTAAEKRAEKRQLMRKIISLFVLLATAAISFALDPGWPRQKVVNGAKLVYYPPQI